jgi:hypothetical protein
MWFYDKLYLAYSIGLLTAVVMNSDIVRNDKSGLAVLGCKTKCCLGQVESILRHYGVISFPNLRKRCARNFKRMD